MKTFRLAQWIMLAEKFDQLKYRRALTAMSVGPVDSDWLTQECGLSLRETRALLRELQRANALIVLPPAANDEAKAVDAPIVPAPRGLPATMRRLRRWLNARATAGRMVGFDDLA